MLPKIICFGDSLTQRGFEVENKGWVASLSNAFVRKADVLNRGYGGYTSEWAKRILPSLSVSIMDDEVLLVIILLGANDAVLEGGRQHTPLEKYKENLKYIVDKIKKTIKCQIIIMNPTPVVCKDWEKQCLQNGRKLDRDESVVHQYAQSCLEVAKQLELPYVDLYDAFIKSEVPMKELFVDGLHYSEKGNQIVYQSLMKKLKEIGLDPEVMKLSFPHHSEVDISDLDSSIVP